MAEPALPPTPTETTESAAVGDAYEHFWATVERDFAKTEAGGAAPHQEPAPPGAAYQKFLDR